MRLSYQVGVDGSPHQTGRGPSPGTAAQKLGIVVVEPVGEKDWPPTSFREDGYHLNSAAASQFSKLVAADLKLMLVDSSDRNSGQ